MGFGLLKNVPKNKYPAKDRASKIEHRPMKMANDFHFELLCSPLHSSCSVSELYIENGITLIKCESSMVEFSKSPSC